MPNLPTGSQAECRTGGHYFFIRPSLFICSLFPFLTSSFVILCSSVHHSPDQGMMNVQPAYRQPGRMSNWRPLLLYSAFLVHLFIIPLPNFFIRYSLFICSSFARLSPGVFIPHSPFSLSLKIIWYNLGISYTVLIILL